ncbi:MAG: hypothetical protein V1793_04420 [Pseudomonadota bacterium]
MKINLHRNARTTPAQRSFIRENRCQSNSDLARRLGVSAATVRKWKSRCSVYDRPHVPRTITTALTPSQELVTALVRLCLRPGLDDLYKIVHDYINPGCSRSGLHRCLQRFHLSRLESLSGRVPVKSTEHLGVYLYCTVIRLPGPGKSWRLLRTTLDLSSRWAHVDLYQPHFPPLNRSLVHELPEKFPGRILGVAGHDPIDLLCPEEPGCCLAAVPPMPPGAECMTRGLHVIKLGSHDPWTINMLKQHTKDLGKLCDPAGEQMLEGLLCRTNQGIEDYNTSIRQVTLRKRTPREVLQQRYLIYPGSFTSRPEQSLGTGSMG